MTRTLRSTPITGASALLRSGPPARPATVLSLLRFRPLEVLPLTTLTRAAVSGRAFPRSMREQQIRLTSPLRRTPLGQSAGTRQACPGTKAPPRFRRRLNEFRHFISDSLTLVFLIPT